MGGADDGRLMCSTQNPYPFIFISDYILFFHVFSRMKLTLECERSAVCLGDNMGHRRPSTYCAYEFSAATVKSKLEIPEETLWKGIASILDTNMHQGRNRNISDDFECIIQH